MDLPSCKSKFSTSPPFRATQLWNEAVSLLQSGMPTRRHFYRMRYYDHCFSGKEAVDWLSKNLKNNPRFGKNVTTEGTRKLLQHFLKSGVFQSVKGSLIFKESGLFEFVNRTIASPSRKQDPKYFSSHMGLKEVDCNVPTDLRFRGTVALFPMDEKRINRMQSLSPCSMNDRTPSKFSQRPQEPSSKIVSWKDFILRRIQSLVPTLSVELLVDPSTIQCDWVKHNLCPEFDNIRKKTELPFWVFTAISSVVQTQEEESEYTTYAGFEKDVYTVVRDYLRHRSSPMIPYNLYELFMYTFNHFHFMDLEIKNRSRERDSVENLMLSMSHEWDDDHLVQMADLTRTVLPPNSCFETAFTSDEPITRIVPQSSVDTLCLTSHKSSKLVSSTNLTQNSSKSQTNLLESYETPFRLTVAKENLLIEKPPTKSVNKCKNRKRASQLRRTQSMAQVDKNAKYNSLPLPTITNKSSKWNNPHLQQSYVNYGLSQSLDDLLVVDNSVGLDFEEAMQSVNCLMRASCGPRPSLPSMSDLNSSSMESLSTVNSYPANKTSLVCIDSCVWYEDVQETARQVFQSVLMLMSPVNRTSLRMLLQFIDHLPVHLHSSMSKTEMVYDLSAHILSPGPQNKNVYSHHMVLSVVYFLVDNCQFIFEDFPQKELLGNLEDKSKENKPIQDQKVYCEQLTKNQFENQGITSSWLALAELLDQIVSDKKMKSKEKKKRLKKFKEAYPHIYRQRFGNSSTSLANLVHFR